MTQFLSDTHKGFYLFDDATVIDTFSISNGDGNDANALTYRLAEKWQYVSPGTTIDIVAEYTDAIQKNSFGIFIETEATDLTFAFAFSDDGISYTDMIAPKSITNVNRKAVSIEVAIDLSTMTIDDETHKFWRIRIQNPSAAAIAIRHVAIALGEFFPRGFNAGITSAGFDSAIKAVGLPKLGFPYGRKYYSRKVGFKGSISLLDPNTEDIRGFWNSYETKPVYIIWNLSTEYNEPIMAYRDLTKAPEKYDSLVTNSMEISGEAFV